MSHQNSSDVNFLTLVHYQIFYITLQLYRYCGSDYVSCPFPAV